MRYMKIGTLISAGVLMLSSMLLNSGCSEAGNGRKQTTENPGAIFRGSEVCRRCQNVDSHCAQRR